MLAYTRVIVVHTLRLWRRAEEALGGAADTSVAVNRGILSLALSKHEVCNAEDIGK